MTAVADQPPLLSVRGLTVTFSTRGGTAYAVRGVDFDEVPRALEREDDPDAEVRRRAAGAAARRSEAGTSSLATCLDSAVICRSPPCSNL